MTAINKMTLPGLNYIRLFYITSQIHILCTEKASLPGRKLWPVLLLPKCIGKHSKLHTLLDWKGYFIITQMKIHSQANWLKIFMFITVHSPQMNSMVLGFFPYIAMELFIISMPWTRQNCGIKGSVLEEELLWSAKLPSRLIPWRLQ